MKNREKKKLEMDIIMPIMILSAIISALLMVVVAILNFYYDSLNFLGPITTFLVPFATISLILYFFFFKLIKGIIEKPIKLYRCLAYFLSLWAWFSVINLIIANLLLDFVKNPIFIIIAIAISIIGGLMTGKYFLRILKSIFSSLYD